MFNSRSLCNKTAGVFEILQDNSIDVCFLSETWLRKNDSAKLSEIKDYGFNMLHQSRPGKGGGVAVAFKRSLNLQRCKSQSYKSFEHIECVLDSSNSGHLRLVSVYRSCTARLSNLKCFFEEFDDYLDSLTNLPGKLIIAGDFNIHVENACDPDSVKFATILRNHGLVQHVQSSTHVHGGTLDLVLTRANGVDSLEVCDVRCEPTVTSSDHYLVSFTCTFTHQRGPQRIIKTGRKIKDIDIDCFKNDLLHSEINNPEKFADCESAATLYHQELRRILDIHAPLLEFNITPGQSKWMNTACQTARTKRRKAERDHKRLNTESTKKAYKEAYNHAAELIDATRNGYYKDRLETNNGNKKETYKIVNQLMDRDLSKNMRPNHKPDSIICEEMKTYFKEKVEKIYTDIENEAMDSKDIPTQELTPDYKGEKWETFKPINEEMLRSVLSDLNTKECEADPIPAKLLLQCIDEVKTILLFIINQSLQAGIFPSAAKSAIVRPAVKDYKSDLNSYKNYRPISNLPFLSKILEKCVQQQLTDHLEVNNLHAEKQSGYRINRSCETATLAVYNDLLCISDARTKVIMLMLDLSAAFDTVCHETLLKKLHKNFGLAGNVLRWFQSYLDGRSFSVIINKSRSGNCILKIGVPQGSILGPILFILYTKELNYIANKHGFNIHLYADDTQMYLEFNPLFEDVSKFEEKIVQCMNDIKNWMLANKLKLNPDKTEVLTVQSRNNFNSWSLDSLHISAKEEPISPSSVVKSLGVKFDSFLNFEHHINAIVQECNMHLRNLWVIGSKLSFELKRQLIHCLIFSRLDYCNGVLYGLPDVALKKLQKIQNSCARFLFGPGVIRKWDSVTPFLKDAHFLPVKQRIEFKLGLMVFKCVNNMAPQYLSECIKVKNEPVKSLRGHEDYFLLDVPPVPNLKRTERSFTYCAPEVWNRLPYELRSCPNVALFKNKLKTFLFIKAFGDS